MGEVNKNFKRVAHIILVLILELSSLSTISLAANEEYDARDLITIVKVDGKSVKN